jgi:hypothetical protein
MDNDSGWAAKEITLTAQERDGHHEHLTLTCRWVELVQSWNGNTDAYFLVSGVDADNLTDQPWEFVAFKDALGQAHRYHLRAASQDGPQAIRLMRGR